MILASHVIISGILGAQTGNYFLAALTGFISHYILDAIPHWDKYLSPEFKKKTELKDGAIFKEKFFWKEISKVVIDILIGTAIFFLIFFKFFSTGSIVSAIVAIFFGVLPDPLQLLYFVTHSRFLKLNYDFQYFLHSVIYKKEPNFLPGILIQIAAIALVFTMTFYL